MARLRFDSPSPSVGSARRRRRRLQAAGEHSPQIRIQRASSFKHFAAPSEKTPLVDHFPPEFGSTLKDSSPLESDYSFLEAPKSPPLIIWIWPALLCALCYALYNIFIKKGSASIHPVLGGVILQIVAAFLGFFLLLAIVLRDGLETLQFDQSGIYWSIVAGMAVGAAEMISFFVMGMGVQAMQAVPIVIGGSVMFGTILGAVWLNEILTFQGWSGVFLLVIGIAMVATDPGSGMAEGHA